MAVLKSIASGNFTDAATWGVIDATSYQNSSDTNVTVLSTSYQLSAAFTPGAITVDGICVKLAVRTGTTGTMSVRLSDAGAEVAGTLVTIDTADLPVAATADANGGWIYFKFATPVLLLAATAYKVDAKTSSASQVSLFRAGSTADWQRALVTTTTQAPAAGDDFILGGEYTGAGASNAINVTMNETATTDYGSASTSLVTPALAICSLGTLTWGTTAATNYNLKLSGNLIIYSNGAMNMGSVGAECPRDSTMKLQFDCGANVDFGMTVRNLGTLVMQGQSRTSGKNIYYCKLNTDEAVNQTTIGVDTDTGWLDNDSIVICSTSRTIAESEVGTLNGAAGASSLTVDGFGGAAGGLAYAHSGTSPTQAEVINLTRNVCIFGASTALQSYITVNATATVDIDWAEFYWLGSGTALKRGIEAYTTTGSFDIKYSSLHDFVVTSSYGIHVAGASGSGISIQYCNFYNINTYHIYVVATTGTWVIDNCFFVRNVAVVNMIVLVDLGGTFTNNTAVSGTGQYVISMSDTNVFTGTFDGNTTHSNTYGPLVGSTSGFVMTNLISWRNGWGLVFSGFSVNVTIGTATMFGNTTSNINLSISTSIVNLTLNNVVFSGDSTFSTPSGITTSGIGVIIGSINDSAFGVTDGIKVAHTTSDITGVGTATYQLALNNCILASTEVSSQSSLATGSYVASQKHDQTAGLHKTWKREGTLTIDTSISDASPALRMTPLSASEKLTSTGRKAIFSAAVGSGNTITVSVKVRESVVGDGTDYNGNRIRLIVRQNHAAGITADTVLDTATVASEGAFETLSGTTAAVTDDAILEFEVDCDGTTGWINVDTWAVTTPVSSLGMTYWHDGQPVSYGDNSSGSGTDNFAKGILVGQQIARAVG